MRNPTNIQKKNPIWSHFNRFWNYRDLIYQFTKRDISNKYKGSYLGIFWTIINPLLMLAVYTFVFSEVFKAKWSTGSTNKLEFAIIIFCGILAFNIMSEVVTKSPSSILSNANYVKKVVFPLEILPIVNICSALFQNAIGYLILIISLLFTQGTIHITVLFFPIVMAPLLVSTIGLGWIFSALGVYLRDISQIIGVGIQALMLLSPIFYPVEAVPEKLRFFYQLNPVGYVVEDLRNILIWGNQPNWKWLVIGSMLSIMIYILGFLVFQKSRKGFADVI